MKYKRLKLELQKFIKAMQEKEESRKSLARTLQNENVLSASIRHKLEYQLERIPTKIKCIYMYI